MSRRLTALPRVPERDPQILIARIQKREREKKNTAVLRRELVLTYCRILRRGAKKQKGAVQ